MKNVDILAANEALAQLAQEKLPIGVGIKIRRLTRQVTEAVEDIEAERHKLLEAHAKRNKETGEMLFLDDAKTEVDVQRPEFDVDYNALLALDADITVDRPLRPQDLGSISVMPALLLMLGDLLEDEDAPV